MNDWLTVPGGMLAAAFVPLHPRWRRDAAERLGWQVAPAVPGSIWIHAASLGELRAASALAAVLDGPILLTTDTDTGGVFARSLAASDPRLVASVMPIDHPFTLAPLWADARPRGVVFVEGAYWPGLAKLARTEGVPVIRVSARAGPRTRAWPIAQRWMPADLIVAQDDRQAEFFRRSAGLRVEVGGDLKGDAPRAPSPLRWSRRFVVAASTRNGDEAALIEDWTGPATLVIAPRQLERVSEVAELLRGRRFLRRSALMDGVVPSDADFLLVDTLGELGSILQGADAAFIGGTFDPAIGGHSPAEATLAGVPVVHGPQVSSNAAAFGEATALAVETPAGVAAALRRASAVRAVPRTNGAAARTAAWVREVLLRDPAPEASPRPWLAPLTRWVSRWNDRRTEAEVRLPVPVVSVGGTNARGSGKTSTALWFAEQLRRRGHRVGVVVRGYRRMAGGDAVRVSNRAEDVSILGDEGALFAQQGFLVAAGRDRIEASRRLIERGVSVILLEDGLQYRRLVRDVDIAVVDGWFPEARGLLPAGERREVEPVPSRVHGVIVHRAPAGPLPWPSAVTAERIPGPWMRGETPCEPPDTGCVAIAGIAIPAGFFSELDRAVDAFRVLGDHEPIDARGAEELFRWAGDRAVLTTAKDHVRFPRPWRDRVFWRGVDLRIDDVPEAWFPKLRT